MALYIRQYGEYTGISEFSTIMIEHEDGKPPNDLKVPAEADWKLGDIIAFSEYRDTGTYIVGADQTLVPNPDYSASGYLTIPLEITSHFPNAFEHYKNHIIDDEAPCVALDLRPDDGWIVSKYGQAFPSEWKKIVLWYSWGEFERLWIEFDNGRNQDFEENTSLEEMLEYWLGTKEKQVSLWLRYNISGQTYDQVREYTKDKELALPVTWTERSGGSGGGADTSWGDVFFYGPEKDLDYALARINHYYYLHGATITRPVAGIKSRVYEFEDK